MVNIARRQISFGIAAMSLSACSGVAGWPGSALAASENERPQPRPDAPAAASPGGYDAFVRGLRPRALTRGVSSKTFDAAFRVAGYRPDVVKQDQAQFQYRRTLEDYIAIATTAERLRIGKAKLRDHRQVLGKIEARYGVQKEVLAAIWGMESSFGARRGDVPVISALSSLAWKSRRGEFFETQLIAALKILDHGDISPAKMTGSWAGAMGHTQFIPTTYQAFAVDFTGDGRRDIWADDPSDALASTAHYLGQSGWAAGKLWGVEVRLPKGRDDLVTRPVGEWRSRGVTLARGGAVPDHGPATLILPNGAGGPAFLLFGNYKVFRRYNNSMKYALAVGHLSDRLAGGAPLIGDFGADAQGMTLEERRELQERLTAKGFDTGGADGVIGDKTTAAIRAYEAAKGLPVSGIASKPLLAHLRG